MEVRLNGVLYDRLPADLHSVPAEWEKEILLFMRDWFSDADFMTGHTSGSTGVPKEIRLLKADMLASAATTNDFFGISPGSNLLLCLSPSYIAGKMMIVRAILAGANLIAVKPSSSPLKGVGEVIDLAAMVPMQVQESLKQPDMAAKLAGVRQLIVGGAPVSTPLEVELSRLSVSSYATYGMTETVSHIALRKLNGKPDCYFALGDVWFETDGRGCLVVHAPHLRQQQFTTNDRVELVDSRHFKWVGRYDHVINSGGVKLSPEQIECKLADTIRERYFITSLPDERLGEKVVLVIEGNVWGDDAVECLREAMNRRLEPFEVPKQILFHTAFRETKSGKVIRKIGSL